MCGQQNMHWNLLIIKLSNAFLIVETLDYECLLFGKKHIWKKTEEIVFGYGNLLLFPKSIYLILFQILFWAKIWISLEVNLKRCTSDQLNTFSPVFFQIRCWSGKNGGKRVQLVRGLSFRGNFLQNPYLVGSFKNILISAGTKNHRQHVKAK